MAWQSEPGRARWYGEVIFEDDDGDTGYRYAYSAALDAPDPRKIFPKSMWGRILGAKVLPISNNKDSQGPEEGAE
ncbi:hypothetical protein C9F11_10285 [Streptomyces sp. YIM 121038]|nr:hypothetical protein C9F11_10285 [Streptomyces sp. YIM 121038]